MEGSKKIQNKTILCFFEFLTVYLLLCNSCRLCIILSYSVYYTHFAKAHVSTGYKPTRKIIQYDLLACGIKEIPCLEYLYSKVQELMIYGAIQH